MILMKTLVSSIILAIAIQSPAQERDRAAEGPEPPNERNTFQVEKRLTLSGCLEFQWNTVDKGKLPISIKIKNPFLEPLSVAAKVHGDPCAEFEIEYYDSYLKEWRRPLGLAGSTMEKSIIVKSGESAVLPFRDEYWHFIRETIPSFKLQDPVRIRLVFDLGDTSLQSPQFKWNRANKTVVVNRLPDPR
jgi:hypothetical protein